MRKRLCKCGKEVKKNFDKKDVFKGYLKTCGDKGRTLCVDCHRKTDTWGRKTL